MTASVAWAQVPALLPGRWEVYEVGFLASAFVPDSVRERLDDPQVADLNVAIQRGEAQLLVEFRPDGTYEFTIDRAGERVRTETGTYTLKNSELSAYSAEPDGSSIHNQHLVKVTKRTLVLAFPVGERLPGIMEEVEYRRSKY
ncbi:MAG: hypothetical protein EOO36_01295 [Cytophagaceae bacterium]|nr:MAG: hypothetical protein EOO36_01295 [Cytophagaceae bacterium]